jgi:Mrp family chromosome partitioning ATPase
MEAYLAKAREEYDIVLIDTPPMIQITDARIVGRLSDAAILIARAGKTSRDLLLVARERFQEDHTRVLGTILNCWDPKREVNSYYAGAYRGYHSYYNDIANRS